MGYVDAKTMIEFKDKLVKKANDKLKQLHNIHTATALNPKISSLHSFEDLIPLFAGHNLYEEGATYSAAVSCRDRHGSRIHYQVNKNGNGFIPSKNDYLHQKKVYLDYNFNSTNHSSMMVIDLLDFLFNNDTIRDMYGYFNATISKVNRFPGVVRPQTVIRIDLTTDLQSVDELIRDNSTNLTLYFKRYKKGSNYISFRGKLYIVKNMFERENGGGKFCEGVYGYLHLIVSINSIDETHSAIYISLLKD